VKGLHRLEAALRGAGYGDRLLKNEPLARHTSFAIGGPADLLLMVRTPEELVGAVQEARRAGVPWRVIGSGTNILVADAGIRGLVIVNACRGYQLEESSGLLRAESGVLLGELAGEVSAAGWAGLAWAVGIPGTVGGAVVNNAGAYGGSVADNLVEVTWLTGRGVETVPAERMQYTYRGSALKSDPGCGTSRIVLEAAFRLERGDPEELAMQVAATLAQRDARIPRGRCAGSVFKRTAQYPAGFLIEQAGLKGRRIGDAEVSPAHANFLMNVGAARAADMKALIDLVRDEVLAKFGECLEPEIQFVGEWGRDGDGSEAGQDGAPDVREA